MNRKLRVGSAKEIKLTGAPLTWRISRFVRHCPFMSYERNT